MKHKVISQTIKLRSLKVRGRESHWLPRKRIRPSWAAYSPQNASHCPALRRTATCAIPQRSSSWISAWPRACRCGARARARRARRGARSGTPAPRRSGSRRGRACGGWRRARPAGAPPSPSPPPPQALALVLAPCGRVGRDGAERTRWRRGASRHGVGVEALEG